MLGNPHHRANNPTNSVTDHQPNGVANVGPDEGSDSVADVVPNSTPHDRLQRPSWSRPCVVRNDTRARHWMRRRFGAACLQRSVQRVSHASTNAEPHAQPIGGTLVVAHRGTHHAAHGRSNRTPNGRTDNDFTNRVADPTSNGRAHSQPDDEPHDHGTLGGAYGDANRGTDATHVL
jgi:hypothetical protein